LRKLISKEVDQLEHLRLPFPASWYGVKTALTSMKDNFITYDHFRTLCTENKELDPDAQNSLATILHQLGTSLNYRDDSRLRDTHILKPQWVTNGIYTLLNNDTLTNCKGVLTVDAMSVILDSKDYPADRHIFLLELMRKFELAFRMDDTDTHYLVTDLLDKQQPEQAKTFDLQTCLNFQYQYPAILPEGILPRFIVRSYTLSIHTPRWRTGVILLKDGNRALIRAERQAKRIDISIDGPIATRKELLAIIRSDFDRIHSSFSFTPTEQVPIPGHPDVSVDYKELLLMAQSDIQTFPKAISGKIEQLSVRDLINGVDLPSKNMPPLKLFYSYSHKDEALRDQLETHLKLLEREKYIEPWHDRRITAGEEWKDEIDFNLESADIILLLISADFIASDYCYDKELSLAMERQKANEARVIPIILRKTEGWSKLAPFGKLQALPKDGTPITLWEDRDSAWADVAGGIRKAISQIQAQKNI
ncbi:MAG: COR domain-containing protein, partial [Cyanobacteria bacterium P01_F01_bin.33]